MLFTGHAEVTIDPKQRLAVPAKYRSQVETTGGLWRCLPWPDGCLRLYPDATFEALAAQLPSSLIPDTDEAELQRSLFGLAERLEPDSVGRITIPKIQIELAGLTTEVMVVGAGDRLEVMDRAKWKANLSDKFQSLPTLVAKMQGKLRGPGSRDTSGRD